MPVNRSAKMQGNYGASWLSSSEGPLGMRRVRRIHMIGIGGAGMSGIAEVLHNLGYQVSGSDLVESAITRRLAGMGLSIRIGHAAEQVESADVVVVSSAVRPTNPEWVAAQLKRIPIVPRAEMLAELMRFRYGIAVAGTHGKTTTTSLVASLLAEGGLDPTFVIGGRLNHFEGHGRLGASQYLVAEADESDGSFLGLHPIMAVVTNIDADHMATYNADFELLKESFIDFLHRLPFYGLAILCLDDPVVRSILHRVTKPFITYGLNAAADVQARNVVQDGPKTRFDVVFNGEAQGFPVTLNLPGHHNVRNALAALAIGRELGVRPEAMQDGLAGFKGIARRLQVYGQACFARGRALFIDDYAHHPREIDATLAAVRQGWPGRRLVVVFQPHRYSRTRDLFDDFAISLSEADGLLVLEVYGAGEEPITGADSRALCRAVRARGRVEPLFVDSLAALPANLDAVVRDGDVVLMLGAGDIGRAAAAVAAERVRDPS